MVNSAHVFPASTDPFALLVIFCFFFFLIFPITGFRGCCF